MSTRTNRNSSDEFPSLVATNTANRAPKSVAKTPNKLWASIAARNNKQEPAPAPRSLAEEVLLKDRTLVSALRESELGDTPLDVSSAPPRLLSDIVEEPLNEIRACDGDNTPESEGMLTQKARTLFELLQKRRSTQQAEESDAAQKEANRSRAVKALNSKNKGNLKQLRRERKNKAAISTSSIEALAKSMSKEDLAKNYPPGIYRVERPVMLRQQKSVSSTPVCKLNKDQLITVSEVSLYVQGDKRSVRAKVTSPYAGWTSLISTSMRRCLTLQCISNSPELLELAERSRIKRMSNTKRHNKHSSSALKKWHQREREARLLAEEGDRRVREHMSRPHQRHNTSRPHQQRNQRAYPNPTGPSMSVQMSVQMNGVPAQHQHQQREAMSCPWDQLDANEMPQMPSGNQYAQNMPVYQGQPGVYYTMMPVQQPTYQNAQYTEQRQAQGAYMVDPEMYGSNSRFQAQVQAQGQTQGQVYYAQENMEYQFANVNFS